MNGIFLGNLDTNTHRGKMMLMWRCREKNSLENGRGEKNQWYHPIFESRAKIQVCSGWEGGKGMQLGQEEVSTAEPQKAQKLEVPCASKALLHPKEWIFISDETTLDYVNSVTMSLFEGHCRKCLTEAISESLFFPTQLPQCEQPGGIKRVLLWEK